MCIRDSYLADSGVDHPIVAVQPDIDWNAGHHRSDFGATQLYGNEGYWVDVDPTTMRTVSP